jgi:hypothetical protein
MYRILLANPMEQQSYPITGLGNTRGIEEAEASKILRQSAYDGGNLVTPKHRPPLRPEKIPDSFVKGCV